MNQLTKRSLAQAAVLIVSGSAMAGFTLHYDVDEWQSASGLRQLRQPRRNGHDLSPPRQLVGDGVQ